MRAESVDTSLVLIEDPDVVWTTRTAIYLDVRDILTTTVFFGSESGAYLKVACRLRDGTKVDGWMLASLFR